MSKEFDVTLQPAYINVILPLKLGWEPFYVLEDWQKVQVGDRVTVLFAGKRYIGTVSAVGSTLPPSISPSSVKRIRCMNTDLPALLPSEIEFFRAVAKYYMCTVGEVFKMAYPSVRDVTPSARASKKPETEIAVSLDCSKDPQVNEMLSLIDQAGKPLLLTGPTAQTLLLPLLHTFFVNARAAREFTKNILWLVPDSKFTKTMEDDARRVFGSALVVYRPDLTPARRRKALQRIRSGEPYIVLGTKSALFLPLQNLGLVVVQDEQEASYKQNGVSPRFNARDAAVLLAAQFNARVVLESISPSLETLHNVATGKYVTTGSVATTGGVVTSGGVVAACKYVPVNENVVAYSPKGTAVPFEIVDTRAELRKNGMLGDISRKLVIAAGEDRVAVYKPRRSMFPKIEELVPQVDAVFCGRATVTDDLLETPIPKGTKVLAIMGIDSQLGRADFRADEKAYHIVQQAIAQCDDSLRLVVVQTRESEHPVFTALATGDASPMLAERQAFNLPPYSRLVDVLVRDTFPDRAARMLSALTHRISAELGLNSMLSADRVRVILPRDRYLIARKESLLNLVADFEKTEKYPSHFSFDVDPL